MQSDTPVRPMCRTAGDILDATARVANKTGFAVEGHVLNLFGQCSECVLPSVYVVSHMPRVASVAYSIY
jgi:hypothetical protein